jgi:flavin reductase (DIM6/NTAB) family NADH-FMN oxidoreductase RutF
VSQAISASVQDEARRLRDALGTFATGVVIVTAWDEEAGALGMTMNSFSSVSLDPPLVLFSVDRRSMGLPAWQRTAGYCINVLSSDQERLSNQFARARGDKWNGVSFRIGLHGAPILSDTLASFECDAHQMLDGGDHVVFLACVQRFRRSDSGSPLLFHRGRYASLLPQAGAEHALPFEWPLSIHY